jgi:hypothetical protein
MTWQPTYGRIIDRHGGRVFVEMLDERGQPSQLPPRWYSVEIGDDGPDWGTVRYHRRLQEWSDEIARKRQF